MAVTAEKVVVELEAEYKQFLADTENATKRFEKALAHMIDSGKATEKQVRDAFKGIGNAANENAGDAEKAGATFGSRFGVGFLRTALSSILGGALFAAIVKDAQAMGDLEDAARRASIPLKEMQEIVYVLRKEGLTESQAVKDIQKLTKLIAESANDPKGGLRRLFEFNGITIDGKDPKTVILDLARLMQDAPEGVKTKVAELAGLSEKWIAVLEKGPDAFRAALAEADKLGVALDDVAFKKAEEFRKTWNEATTRWGDGLRSAITEVLPLLDTLITKALSFVETLGKGISGLADYSFVSGRLIAAELSGGIGGLEYLTEKQLQIARTIATGPFGSADALARVEREELNRLNPTETSPPRVYISTGNNSTRIPPRRAASKNEYDRAEDAVRKRIALLEAEAEAVGKTRQETDELRVAAELLDAARRAGLDTTDPQVIANARALAREYAIVADNTRLMKERFQAGQEVIRAFGNEAIDGIQGLIEGTKTLNDVAASTLRTFSKMALQAALLGEGPLATFFGTKSPVAGGAGGLLGSLLGGVFGGFRAGGGPVNPGKSYIVGENGPELFTPNMAGLITPNGAATHSSGGGVTMFNDFRDASANAIPAIMMRIAQLERNFPKMVPPAYRDARRTNPWV